MHEMYSPALRFLQGQPGRRLLSSGSLARVRLGLGAVDFNKR